MHKNNFKRLALLFLTIVSGALFTTAQTPKAEFMSLDSARPVLEKMKDSLPPQLKAKGVVDESLWASWIQGEDAAIRQRLTTGEEDTLTNLLRFGVTFTKEYPIDRDYLGLYGHSALVNSFAENRADDLIRALASPASNEGMQHMRALLEQKGFSFNTPQERARVKKYLLSNLARMRDEFIRFGEQLAKATISQGSTLYEDRGISLDTNLGPDFALDTELREMARTGMLKPGSVRRLAIVGPGLDFANKEYGNDFYPPQTIQPFAVIDSLVRLGLANPRSLELYTLDISPSVNLHVARARKKALQGKPYTVQLPWSTAVPRNQEYLTEFTKYWKSLGDQIGAPAKPVAIPNAPTTGQLYLRAVTIRPQFVTRIQPIDMNIVFQRLVLSPDERFDLVIGTNIFIYYGPFEQSLARVNLASILKPDGFLLSNDLLSDQVSSKLKEVRRSSITLSTSPAITDYMFCYRREP